MTNQFDKVSFSISLQELIQMGYLVPPELRSIAIVDSDQDHAVIANVVSLYMLHEKGRKAVVYLRSIDDAKLLRNAFETVGVRSRAVTSDVPASSRADIYSDFRSGSTDVLCTVDVLTAGFDAPIIEAIFMPYGTKSPTQYLQRVGRGLRVYEGKSSCRVYMFGDSPTVSRAVYEKLNKQVLNAGKPAGSQDTYRDELDFSVMKEGSEIYHWTKDVVDLVKKMEKLGMSHFASLLDSKKFPEQFMRSVTDLMARLPLRKTSLPGGDGEATAGQQSFLFNAGFPGATVSALTKAEASMMISAITNRRNDPTGEAAAFIVQEGQHQGKHVSELPHAYRTIVLRRYPNSRVAHQLTAWKARKRRAK